MKMQIRTSATLSQPSTTKQNRERETEERDDEEENSKKKALTILWAREPWQALYNRVSNCLRE